MDFGEAIRKRRSEEFEQRSSQAENEARAEETQVALEAFWDPRVGLPIDESNFLNSSAKRALKGFALSLSKANVPHETTEGVPISYEMPRFAAREAIIKLTTKSYEMNRDSRMMKLSDKRFEARRAAMRPMSLGGWTVERNSGDWVDGIEPSTMIVTPDFKIKTADASAEQLDRPIELFDITHSPRSGFVPHELLMGLHADNYSRFLRKNFNSQEIIKSVVARAARLGVDWVEPDR